MTNYKQTEMQGEAWQRAAQVVIDNPYQGTPRISFLEEEIIQLGDRLIRNPVAGVGTDFIAGSAFPLINPLDDSQLGQTMSHEMVQVILYSLYKFLCKQRDKVA